MLSRSSIHTSKKWNFYLIIFELLDGFRAHRIRDAMPVNRLTRTQEYSMQIDIQARGFVLTEALRQHCERRLRFAVGAGGSRLSGITVRLTDVNGPRGGVDKRCTIRATLPGCPPIFIAHVETDAYAAVDRAAERAARALSRQLKRSLNEHRRWSVKPNTPVDAGTHPS
jgi:putative sigma-54 modulation protein